MDMHRWPTVRYEDLEPRLRTGDVFLFHGASRRSRIIETVTESEFSHIGMIVRPQGGKPPLLWHTDPRAVTEDAEDDEEHGGAQLNDLTAALAVMTSPGYGDTPFVRQLIVERTPEMDEMVLQAIAAEDNISSRNGCWAGSISQRRMSAWIARRPWRSLTSGWDCCHPSHHRTLTLRETSARST